MADGLPKQCHECRPDGSCPRFDAVLQTLIDHGAMAHILGHMGGYLHSLSLRADTGLVRSVVVDGVQCALCALGYPRDFRTCVDVEGYHHYVMAFNTWERCANNPSHKTSIEVRGVEVLDHAVVEFEQGIFRVPREAPTVAARIMAEAADEVRSRRCSQCKRSWNRPVLAKGEHVELCPECQRPLPPLDLFP